MNFLPMALGLFSTGLNAIGAQASYYASKTNAVIQEQQGIIDNEIAKANAQAIEFQAEYNSNVQYNNAVARAQTKGFENSVIKANRLALMQKYENRRDVLFQNIRDSVAQQVASNTQLSKDVLNSIEMAAFSEISDLDLDYSLNMQSMGAQMSENDRTAAIEISHGRSESMNTLLAGRNNAFFTRLSGQNAMSSARLRAGQTRLQGRADRIGAFSNSLSSAAQFIS